MKQLLVLCSFAIAFSAGESQVVQRLETSPARQEAFQRPVKSPEVGSDGRVTFRLRAPNAKDVSLTGEFMHGSKPLAKDAAGIWSFTTDPLRPEIYAYNFTIDGVKTIDPSNAAVKTGSTAATIQSLLEVPGETPAFYDARPVAHGEIRTEWYESKSLHSIRRLTIYTPPGFRFERSDPLSDALSSPWRQCGRNCLDHVGHVNLILDNLAFEKKIQPFIVVMPFGYGAAPGTQPFNGSFTGISDTFSKDLLGDVIPYVEARFPVFKDRDHRAIAGLSMGGVESLTIGLNHLETFSYVAGFSAAVRPGFPARFCSPCGQSR